MASKLNRNQIAFCNAYIANGGSGVEAYRTAYPNTKMNDTSVHREVRRAMKRPLIVAYLAAARAEAAAIANVTLSEVLVELAHMLRADIADAFHPDGRVKNVHEMPRDFRRNLKVIKTRKVLDRRTTGDNKPYIEEWVTEIRMEGKDSTLDKLMKHLGGYEQNNAQRRPHEHMTDDELNAAIAEALRVAQLPVPDPGTATPDVPGKPPRIH